MNNKNLGYDYWKRVDSLNPYASVKELAVSCGIDYVRMVNQRSDCRLPKCEDVLATAQKLGISMEYLLTGTDSFTVAQRLVSQDKDLERLVIYLSSHETAKKGLMEAFSLKKGSAVEIVG